VTQCSVSVSILARGLVGISELLPGLKMALPLVRRVRHKTSHHVALRRDPLATAPVLDEEWAAQIHALPRLPMVCPNRVVHFFGFKGAGNLCTTAFGETLGNRCSA